MTSVHSFKISDSILLLNYRLSSSQKNRAAIDTASEYWNSLVKLSEEQYNKLSGLNTLRNTIDEIACTQRKLNECQKDRKNVRDSLFAAQSRLKDVIDHKKSIKSSDPAVLELTKKEHDLSVEIDLLDGKLNEAEREESFVSREVEVLVSHMRDQEAFNSLIHRRMSMIFPVISAILSLLFFYLSKYRPQQRQLEDQAGVSFFLYKQQFDNAVLLSRAVTDCVPNQHQVLPEICRFIARF
ncbi:hypothetical protein Ciccas_005361 [Cichlidogyrus casuarinus]|uniref:Uncharacterized protein n=1 Tax=Cichlidogyrus casuarinus TaxID=1844966 RepID=A0ABD2Q8U3_9PLAT